MVTGRRRGRHPWARDGDHRLLGIAAATVPSGATNLTTIPPGGLPAPGTGDGGNLGQGRGPGEGHGVSGPNRGLTPAVAEGAPGARRGAGTVPAGGAPGRRAEGAEDIERERPSYLVERDPQGLFGTDERTAPPVIG